MSVNVRIGNDVIENVKAVQLEDADNEGAYCIFRSGQTITRRATNRGGSLPTTQAGQYVPTTEDTVMAVSVSITVPTEETILDISWVGSIEGGAYVWNRDNFFIAPNTSWGHEGDPDSQLTLTKTPTENGTLVTLRFTTEGSSMWRAVFAQGLNRGNLRACLHLIITSTT